MDELTDTQRRFAERYEEGRVPWDDPTPVSYTHLDVYKRQLLFLDAVGRHLPDEPILRHQPDGGTLSLCPRCAQLVDARGHDCPATATRLVEKGREVCDDCEMCIRDSV